MNPFQLTNYIGPLYFCDRENETENILNAINSQRSITLFAIRRIGKTGLINHVFHHLNKNQKDVLPIYIDILDTKNEKEFVNKLISESLTALKEDSDTFLKKSLQTLSQLKPKLSWDMLTGNPTIELDIRTTEDINIGMTTLFNYIREKNKKVVIAIDEFQQIEQYPSSSIAASLREFMQKTENTSFIFSGSQKHLLLQLFTSPKKALFRSTQLMELDKLDHDTYKVFIKHHFKQGLFKISDVLIDEILEWTMRHTFYTQYFCNHLYSSTSDKSITLDTLNRIKLQILKENEMVYYTYKSLCTSNQWELLKAICIEESISAITSNKFIQKHKLGAHSTIRQATTFLEDKELIYTTIDPTTEKPVYHPYDPFLMRWVQYKRSN